MATPIIDDFETYNTGQLHGQTGGTPSSAWDGATQYTVENTVVKSGSQAVSCHLVDTNDYTITKTGTAIATGSFTIYLRFDYPVGHPEYCLFDMRFLSGAHITVGIQTVGTAWKYYNSSAGLTSFYTGLVSGQWYALQFQWDVGANTIKYRIDNESWTADVAQRENFNPTNFSIEVVGNGGTIDFYMDNLKENAYEIYTMACTPATYTLTGQTEGNYVIKKMICTPASYILTGLTASLEKVIDIWKELTKHTSTFANKVKNIATFANKTKNTTTFSNSTKNTSTFTNKSKNSSNWTNKTKS